jgi:hypothetical protein
MPDNELLGATVTPKRAHFSQTGGFLSGLPLLYCHGPHLGLLPLVTLMQRRDLHPLPSHSSSSHMEDMRRVQGINLVMPMHLKLCNFEQTGLMTAAIVSGLSATFLRAEKEVQGCPEFY